MHKFHYQNLPFALSVYCERPEHRYSTRYRTSLNYVLPRAVTNRGQGSIKFAGPKVWADVPKHIKEVAFTKPYSKKLKEHVLTQIFVEMPVKRNPKINQGGYDELKQIFQTDDENDEFLGFESTFLSEHENASLSEYDLTKSINLDDIFQSDSEDANDEFLGFLPEEFENVDLEILFLNDGSDVDFLGF